MLLRYNSPDGALFRFELREYIEGSYSPDFFADLNSDLSACSIDDDGNYIVTFQQLVELADYWKDAEEVYNYGRNHDGHRRDITRDNAPDVADDAPLWVFTYELITPSRNRC